MSLARLHLVIQDDEGNIIDGASITITRESTGGLAVPKSDRAGTTPLGNPYTAADGRDAGCYLVGGDYRVDVVKDDLSFTMRHVGCGTAAEVDAPISGEVHDYTDADISGGAITIGDTVGYARINVTSAVNLNIPAAADRDTLDLMIKDVSGSASTHNLTPVFDGAEQCDGLSGTALKIATNYGWLAIRPKSGGYEVIGSQL